MPPEKYFAVLKSVNVGGKNLIAAGDLRALFESLGLRQVRTLLQSGNIVFQTQDSTIPAMEERLESALSERLEIQTAVFVREAADLDKIIGQNPFPDAAASDPSHLLVMFLKKVASDRAIESLRASVRGREQIRAGGSHIYLHYPDGIGRSKLTTAVIEKHLGMQGTGRNWNTLLKIRATALDGP